jgi:DNA-binding MltR family transcriptional regulator
MQFDRLLKAGAANYQCSAFGFLIVRVDRFKFGLHAIQRLDEQVFRQIEQAVAGVLTKLNSTDGGGCKMDLRLAVLP